MRCESTHEQGLPVLSPKFFDRDQALIEKTVRDVEEEYEDPGLCTIEGFRELLEGDDTLLEFTRNDTFMNNSNLRINLLFFTVLWTTAFFNYYLLNFEMKYLKGNVFVNNATSGFSELCSLTMPFLFLEKFGIKLFLLIA